MNSKIFQYENCFVPDELYYFHISSLL